MQDFSNIKIGIALSGGGARGIAHIGILKALLEAGIKPTVVAGTSSGAIVGCLYAYGLSIDKIEAFAQIGSSLKLLRIGNPMKGLIKLTLLREKLEGVLPCDDFSCLSMPLAVVSSDIQRGRVAIHREGEVITAVQASCAIPLVFRPVEIDGYQHIDGGLYMNLPAQPIRSEVDFLIGSNVMPLLNVEVEALTSVFGIANRVFDLSVNNTSADSRELCDFLIEPENVTGFHVYNFTKTNELIQTGYEAAKARIPALKIKLEDAVYAMKTKGVMP